MPIMPLDLLLAEVTLEDRSGGSAEISAVAYDSRAVTPGTLFVAMKGGATDGNRYIDQVIANGAAAIATDTASNFGALRLPALLVPHGRRALAEIARAFYRHPDRKLGLTGITGTNGKTTTASLLRQFLEGQHKRTILIGTIDYRIGERVLPSPHTTPESSDLLAIFAQGLAEGACEAVMEVSSHALEQGRAWQLDFDVAVFTNLTRDHLDYHGTMEDYLRAKQRLFDGSNGQVPRSAVINADDAAAGQLSAAARSAGSRVLSYGIGGGDFRATAIELSAKGTRFTLETPQGAFAMSSGLIGRMNVYNLVAAATAAYARGLAWAQIASASEKLQAPAGRFQTIDCGQPFTVIVDYAHTDDALRNAAGLAREIVAATGGRLLTVFGCGGDRDRSKRPLMGRAAGDSSDVVIVTSDNPRSEEPRAIIDEILPGLEGTCAQVVVEADRARAIGIALQSARPGDLVLIAGKGHEKTQTIGTDVLPFDDAAMARQTLSALQGRGGS